MSIVINKRPYANNWSGNPIAYELYSAAAAADPTIYFEVRIMLRYPGASYAEIVRLPYAPVSGKAIVFIQDILDSALEYGLPGFDVDEKKSWVNTKQTGYFFLSYREITTATPGPWIDDETDFERFVLKGGISYHKWRGNNFFANYFTGTDKPFLTWMKNGRLAAYDERMYLCYLHNSDEAVTGIKVELKYWLVNGTVATHTVNLTAVSQPLGSVFYVPAGAAQWDINTLAGNAAAVDHWRIRITRASGADAHLSEEFIFYCDNRKDYNATTLHYRNSLGGLDSARVRGVIDYTVDFENETVVNVTEQDYFDGTTVKPLMQMVNNAEKTIYKGDIGFVNKEDNDRLRDLHLQREIWWEVEEKWLPVINVTGNYKLKSSNDKKWAMPIEWMLAVPGDAYYTPIGAAIGDAAASSNVCGGTVSGVSFLFPETPDLTTVEIHATVTGATKFTYQIFGFHASPIQANVADLPVTVSVLPANESFVIELKAVCADDSTGKPYRNIFSSMVSANDSVVINHAGFTEDWKVYIDNVLNHTAVLDDGEEEFFAYGGSGTHDVKVTHDSGTPTLAKLICDAGVFYGIIAAGQTTWDDVVITGGFIIEMY